MSTPCTVCQLRGSVNRGLKWPTVTFAGVTVHKVCELELISCQRIVSEATVGEPVVRWHSNGACVPSDLMELARDALGLVSDEQVQATAAARARETAAALDRYRAQQAGRPVDEEQRAQARAAFGPGVQVVDVISGRQYTT